MAVRNMKVGGIMHCLVSDDVVVIVVIDGGGRNMWLSLLLFQ